MLAKEKYDLFYKIASNLDFETQKRITCIIKILSFNIMESSKQIREYKHEINEFDANFYATQLASLRFPAFIS